MECAQLNWQGIGVILAGEAAYAFVLAFVVRKLSRSQMIGQTYWMVVLGVAGVVVLAGPMIGWDNVTFLAAAFAVAGAVMGVEYFTRLIAEQDEARKAREESVK